MFIKAYQGDVFEVLGEAYEEDPSNVIGMIKVCLRQGSQWYLV